MLAAVGQQLRVAPRLASEHGAERGAEVREHVASADDEPEDLTVHGDDLAPGRSFMVETSSSSFTGPACITRGAGKCAGAPSVPSLKSVAKGCEGFSAGPRRDDDAHSLDYSRRSNAGPAEDLQMVTDFDSGH